MWFWYAAAHRLRAIPLRQVAAGVSAIRRGNLQSVVVVYVALGARRGHVRTGQRETSHGVVKRRHIGPRDCVVTLRAIGRRKSRSRGGMHRVIRLLPGRQVAAGIPAIRGGNLQIVIVVDVALRTLQVCVPVRQREAGRAVIEGHVGPCRRVVAVRTIRQGEGRAGARMRRVIGLLPGGEVAARVAAIRCRNL